MRSSIATALCGWLSTPIAAKAGVTKRTLYYHFRSKDDLLAAALEAHSELALARIRHWGAGLPADPRRAVVRPSLPSSAAGRAARTSKARATRASSWNSPTSPDIRRAQIARRHKAVVEAWLADELAARGVAGAPEEAARRIVAPLEGAVASMLIHGDRAYVRAGGGDGEAGRGGSGRGVEPAVDYVAFRSRIASVRSRSAFSLMNPSASFWS